MGATSSVVGIDVGADAAWLVALDLGEPPQVVASALSHPVDLGTIAAFCKGAAAVMVDAPGEPSRQPHLDDVRLPPKFRRARCGEIALRAKARIAVPWVTPASDSPTTPPWMRTGFRIWRALRAEGLEPMETYPHGIFSRLAGAPVTHKQRPSGHLRRIEVLRVRVVPPQHVEQWSHDGLDGLAAALTGWYVARDEAERLDCAGDDEWPTHDGSAIWLPPRSTVRGSGHGGSGEGR
jgi:predicted nuclease with RNAse H fold